MSCPARVVQQASSITYDQIAPILGLTSPPTFEPFPIYRSRLPLRVVKDVCRQIDYTRVINEDHSFAGQHVDSRCRYIAAVRIHTPRLISS